MSASEEVQILQQEYQNLMHSMQTGVAYLMEHDEGITAPKHLRVGVNSMLVSVSALVKMLIDRELITELEYWQELVKACRQEVEMYEGQLKDILGSSVTLL